MPTLVYEPRYPRTRRVRWHYVARKLAEAAACALFQYAVMKQFMLPVLEQASRPPPHAAGGVPWPTTRPLAACPQGTKTGGSGGAQVAEVDGLRVAAEYAYTMMRLAMPSLFVWLTGFYMLFHCWCNALAEVCACVCRQGVVLIARLLRHTSRQVLRFADRKFYGTWWNATDLRSFWKLWNLREWVF